MTKIPEAVWSGTFNVMGVDVKCYVLDDGRRIIDSNDAAKLFGDDVVVFDDNGMNEFVQWLTAKVPVE